MTWLSEIEFEDYDESRVLVRRIDALRMDSVVNELLEKLRNAYTSIDIARDELPHEKYDAEATLQAAQDHRGDNLSPDAKELLE